MSFRRVVTEPPWSSRPSTVDELVLRGRTSHELWGFGQHPSTSLCLSLLAGLYAEGAPGPRRVVELECGSGLLCIAASLLGAQEVIGLEEDAAVRLVAEENAQRNRASVQLCSAGEAAARGLLAAPFDLVVANLTGIALHARAARLAALAARGHLLLAGFGEDEREAVEQELGARGFRFLYREAREGSVASVLKARDASATPPRMQPD